MPEHSHRMEHSHNREDQDAGEITETSVIEVTHDHESGDTAHHHVKPSELKREPEKKADNPRTLWGPYNG